MKKKKLMIIPFVLGIVLIVLGLVINNKSTDDGKTNHKDEFTVIESNYLEKNYERYMAYKRHNRDYSDDQVITYVNIGLDKKEYSEAEKANLNDGILMLVNKHYFVDKDYAPKTVSIGPLNALLQEDAAKDFNRMVEASKSARINIFPLKAYTSYDEQDTICLIAAEEQGTTVAEKKCAKPGYSEYQTGLAVSISGNDDNFRYTKEYAWLTNYAHEYGFIIRYPEGKEKITGFESEPWHFRYVGPDAAKIIYEKHITLEEYYSKYVAK